jgi:hypothetical protein
MNITPLRIGNVAVDSIIERDGPWRTPADLFPAYDPETARAHFAEMDNFGFDPQSGRIVITYQTFVLRTPHHTILVDTCTGEDKNYPAPMNFPKQPWLDGFASLGLGFEDIDYVFCTHLHIEHCGWNTRLVGGRWVADLPKGAIHLSQTCREPDWSTIFCWDPRLQRLPRQPAFPSSAARCWKAASAPRHRRNCSQRFRPCAGVASYSGHYCSKMILPPLDLFIATFNSSCRRAPDSVLRSTKKNWRSTGATVANRANHITFSAHRDCTLAQSIF